MVANGPYQACLPPEQRKLAGDRWHLKGKKSWHWLNHCHCFCHKEASNIKTFFILAPLLAPEIVFSSLWYSLQLLQVSLETTDCYQARLTYWQLMWSTLLVHLPLKATLAPPPIQQKSWGRNLKAARANVFLLLKCLLSKCIFKYTINMQQST